MGKNQPPVRGDDAQHAEIAGRDLVFLTGAPGSRWSAVGFAMSFGTGVNNSDRLPHREYPGDALVYHYGNYFGPGMEFDVSAEQLAAMGSLEMQRLFAMPYRSRQGVKVIKGHVFAQALDHLRQAFPAATFVLVWRDDNACLDWWLEAGGFGIAYPDYSVYQDIEAMRERIADDNRAIRSFAGRMGGVFRIGYSVEELTAAIECPIASSASTEVPPELSAILPTIDVCVVRPQVREP